MCYKLTLALRQPAPREDQGQENLMDTRRAPTNDPLISQPFAETILGTQ